MGKNNKFWASIVGREIGIFYNFEHFHKATHGFSAKGNGHNFGKIHGGFKTKKEAEQFLAKRAEKIANLAAKTGKIGIVARITKFSRKMATECGFFKFEISDPDTSIKVNKYFQSRICSR